MFKRIYIEITNNCNLHCFFCPSTKRKRQDMSITNFKKVLKQIKGHTEYIYLHVMGEPLLHPHLKEILNASAKEEFKVIITTNSRLLKEKIDIINAASNIKQINISLHSFDLNNYTVIEDLLDTIEKINKQIFFSIRLWNLGKGQDNKLIANYLGEYFKIDNLYDQCLSKKSVKLNDNIYLNQDVEFMWPTLKTSVITEKGTCYGLRSQLAILVDGTVVPCCLDSEGEINLGNILEEELDTILNKEKCKQIITGFRNNKLVESLCKRCDYIKRFNKQNNKCKEEKFIIVND